MSSEFTFGDNILECTIFRFLHMWSPVFPAKYAWCLFLSAVPPPRFVPYCHCAALSLSVMLFVRKQPRPTETGNSVLTKSGTPNSTRIPSAILELDPRTSCLSFRLHKDSASHLSSDSSFTRYTLWSVTVASFEQLIHCARFVFFDIVLGWALWMKFWYLSTWERECWWFCYLGSVRHPRTRYFG